jgi:hypothetical protein
MNLSRFILSVLLAGGWAFAEPAGKTEAPILVDRYLSAAQSQKDYLRDMKMEVEIDAKVPRLNKWGKLTGWRYVSRLGKITYDALKFDGDNQIKKEVIARFLSAETQAVDSPQMAIDPSNYKFSYKGLQEKLGHRVHVFRLDPRKKAVGLFKGELWLDEATCQPVRESGRFVKNPSVFFKKVEFVRHFEVQDGVAVPKRLDSFADTRLVGRVELNIVFTNYSRLNSEPIVLAEEGQQD